MNLLQRLSTQDPERHVMYTAFDTLTDTNEIGTFFDEFVTALMRDPDNRPGYTLEHARVDALRYVGQGIGHTSEAIYQRWKTVIPGLRNIGFDDPSLTADGAVQLGARLYDKRKSVSDN